MSQNTPKVRFSGMSARFMRRFSRSHIQTWIQWNDPPGTGGILHVIVRDRQFYPRRSRRMAGK